MHEQAYQKILLRQIGKNRPHSGWTSHPACLQLPEGSCSQDCSGQVLQTDKRSAGHILSQRELKAASVRQLTVDRLSFKASQTAHKLPVFDIFFLLQRLFQRDTI